MCLTGNTGGLGGVFGIAYAIGRALPGISSRPLPEIFSRLQKQIVSPFTGIGVDDYVVQSDAKTTPPAVAYAAPMQKLPPRPPAQLPPPIAKVQSDAPKVSAPKVPQPPKFVLAIPSPRLPSPPKSQTASSTPSATKARVPVDKNPSDPVTDAFKSLFGVSNESEKETVKAATSEKQPAVAVKRSVEKEKSAAAQNAVAKAAAAEKAEGEAAAKAKTDSAEKENAARKAKADAFAKAAAAKKTEVEARARAREIADAAKKEQEERQKAMAAKMAAAAKAKKEVAAAKAREGREKAAAAAKKAEMEAARRIKSEADAKAKAKQKAVSSAEKSLKAAKAGTTINLAALFGGSRALVGEEQGPARPTTASTKPAPRKAPAVAPKGIPSLSKWKKNRDGSITGLISGSPVFEDGEEIATSSIAEGEITAGSVVQTKSGSKYFLS